MVVHKVRKEDLQVGAIVEREEHPWASERTARRIAKDHLQENPKAYAGGGKNCGSEKESIIVLNQNIKVKTQKPKKKPLPPPQRPAWQTWGQELL